MGWLSHTEEGGATCFTRDFSEKIHPIKGAGIFWINTSRSLTTNYKMMHGGCPVLIGSKTIINSWPFAYSQWRAWNCGLHEFTEFNVYQDLI